MKKEYTDQVDRVESRTLCSFTCDEYCSKDHDRFMWLASADKWFCSNCLLDFWWDELSSLLLEAACWTGETDEQDILDHCTYEPECDKEDEFTHFAFTTPNQGDGGSGKITLEMLEKEKAVSDSFMCGSTQPEPKGERCRCFAKSNPFAILVWTEEEEDSE